MLRLHRTHLRSLNTRSVLHPWSTRSFEQPQEHFSSTSARNCRYPLRNSSLYCCLVVLPVVQGGHQGDQRKARQSWMVNHPQRRSSISDRMHHCQDGGRPDTSCLGKEWCYVRSERQGSLSHYCELHDLRNYQCIRLLCPRPILLGHRSQEICWNDLKLV